MSALADTDARRRILTEFGTSFFVEAAAGTGKTTALVGRIVGLIRAGAGTLDRVVAVTFTEKAAGEMKLRLRSEIEKARPLGAPEERNRLDRALEQLELARIGTIHAFCGDLLHERPIEAGIDPLFEVASQVSPKRLLKKPSKAGSSAASPIRRRASDGFSDADRAGSPLASNCAVPCRTSASTAIFQNLGAVIPSNEAALSIR